MILLDANVLIASHRADHAHHELVRPWFDGVTSGTEPYFVPGVVWAAFIRIVTNRRIFAVPSPLPDAFTFLRATIAQRAYVRIEPGEAHPALFERTCLDADAGGDLATDAYLAALAIENGATLASLDRDFARFESLRWERPG